MGNACGGLCTKEGAADAAAEAELRLRFRAELPERTIVAAGDLEVAREAIAGATAAIKAWGAKPRALHLPHLRDYAAGAAELGWAGAEPLQESGERVAGLAAAANAHRLAVAAGVVEALQLAKAKVESVLATKAAVRKAAVEFERARAVRDKTDKGAQKAIAKAAKSGGEPRGPTLDDVAAADAKMEAARRHKEAEDDAFVAATAALKAELVEILAGALSKWRDALVALARRSEAIALYGKLKEDDTTAVSEAPASPEGAQDGSRGSEAPALKRKLTPGYERTRVDAAKLGATMVTSHRAAKRAAELKLAAYLRYHALADPLAALSERLEKHHSALRKTGFYVDKFVTSNSSGPLPKLDGLMAIESAFHQLVTIGAAPADSADRMTELRAVGEARDEMVRKVKDLCGVPVEVLLQKTVEPAVLAAVALRSEWAGMQVAELNLSKATDSAKAQALEDKLAGAREDVLNKAKALHAMTRNPSSGDSIAPSLVDSGSGVEGLSNALLDGSDAIVDKHVEGLDAYLRQQADFHRATTTALGGSPLVMPAAVKAEEKRVSYVEALRSLEHATAKLARLQRLNYDAHEAEKEKAKAQQQVQDARSAMQRAAKKAEPEELKEAHAAKMRAQELVRDAEVQKAQIARWKAAVKAAVVRAKEEGLEPEEETAVQQAEVQLDDVEDLEADDDYPESVEEDNDEEALQQELARQQAEA